MGGFIVGTVVGIIVTLWTAVLVPEDATRQMQEAVAACEASLARDQHCKPVITAKVKK